MQKQFTVQNPREWNGMSYKKQKQSLFNRTCNYVAIDKAS